MPLLHLEPNPDLELTEDGPAPQHYNCNTVVFPSANKVRMLSLRIYTGEDLKWLSEAEPRRGVILNRYRYKPSASPYRSFKD